MAVSDWVKSIVEQEFPCQMEIGKTIKHPDGRSVIVTDGRFWGTYGISNFWYWREVFPDGTLGPKENGYGW